MGLATMTMYYAECDGCGTNVTEDAHGGEYVAWPQTDMVIETAVEGGAVSCGNVLLCEDCAATYMVPMVDVNDELWEDTHDGKPYAVTLVRAWAIQRRATFDAMTPGFLDRASKVKPDDGDDEGMGTEPEYPFPGWIWLKGKLGR